MFGCLGIRDWRLRPTVRSMIEEWVLNDTINFGVQHGDCERSVS